MNALFYFSIGLMSVITPLNNSSVVGLLKNSLGQSRTSLIFALASGSLPAPATTSRVDACFKWFIDSISFQAVVKAPSPVAATRLSRFWAEGTRTSLDESSESLFIDASEAACYAANRAPLAADFSSALIWVFLFGMAA